jgi:arylformamidase
VARLVDVSVSISPDLPTWPGDPPVVVEPAKRIAAGDAANVSLLSMGSHTGTHVDPPSHFLEGGGTVEELEPDVLMGPAWVADLPGRTGEIGATELEAAGVPAGTERLLMKTSNSGSLVAGATVRDEFACLSAEAARWVVERGFRLVGVDYLSVERADAPKEHPVHRILLEAGVVIVEGLDLSEAPPGPCELLCLPLRLAGGDGAPARVFLRIEG